MKYERGQLLRNDGRNIICTAIILKVEPTHINALCIHHSRKPWLQGDTIEIPRDRLLKIPLSMWNNQGISSYDMKWGADPLIQ